MNRFCRRFLVISSSIGLAPGSIGLCGAWTSAAGPLSDAVHQDAIDRALTTLTAEDRNLLKQQQTVVDQDQEPSQSAEHAMTGIAADGELPTVEKPRYIALSEALVRQQINQAIDARRRNERQAALTALGRAIHTMTDATSPSHERFQIWSYDFGLFEMARHVAKERVYPDDSGTQHYRSRLEGAVRYAYDLYSETAPLPPKFFDAVDGHLILPAHYLPAN